MRPSVAVLTLASTAGALLDPLTLIREKAGQAVTRRQHAPPAGMATATVALG